ncbi:MAG TPA: ATP-binding protein [Gemmatimonadaceae bacterium]|nr:ATP-binding protein [Gemmatimonadaceae bacterium]
MKILGKRLRLSTAQTLSLVTIVVVAAVLALCLAAVKVSLTRSAVEAAQYRVERSVKQLAAVAATNIANSRGHYAPATTNPAVLAALREDRVPSGPRLDSIASALTEVRVEADSGRPIELWSSTGKRLAFVGDDVTEQVPLQQPSELPLPAQSLRPGLHLGSAVDSIQIGTLYRNANRTLFWVAVPVVSKGKTVGYVLKQSQIARSPQTERTVQELSGNATIGYFHNIDGSVWTTIGGVPAQPPDGISAGGDRARPEIGSVIYADERIPGTPLALAMEVPRTAVIQRATTSVRRLAMVSAALTFLGALVAWLIGKRVARPLRELTAAAESVARGDYTTRVPADGNEEVSRLAASFNNMATQVGESRALLEAREAELRTLANTMPQIAWMADSEGKATWFNERWYEYTGFTSAQDSPTIGAMAVDPELLPELGRAWEASRRSGTPFEMETRLRGKDGTFRWFLTRIAPVRTRDGSVARWFGTSTDIQVLREAREAAEAGNRAKSDFLAAMSHELRTPLNAIGGYAELIDMGLRGPVSDEQRRDLARIRASQAHLLGLIGGLLDLSRIENGHVQYDIQSVGVAPMLADIEALVHPQAAAKAQHLSCHTRAPDLAVRADREKLRQVLLNLLSNAVRHSPVGATITVVAERRESDRVVIEVSDTGPGIPPERQQAIFEPFVQLDRSFTKSTEGVGLGLAISRDLARGMGGDITVRSTPGEGACFALSLPAAFMDGHTQMARSAEMAAMKVQRGERPENKSRVGDPSGGQ